MIKEVDKGGSVVILNTSNYEEEALHQLQNTSTYQILDMDPTPVFRQQMINLLDTGVQMRVFDRKVAEHLMANLPIVPIFHHMPKLHKNIIPVQR